MLDLKEASIEIREIINNRQKELKLTFEEETHTYTMVDTNNLVKNDKDEDVQCAGKIKLDINLMDIKPTKNEEHSNKIMLTDKLGIVMKYPSFDVISKLNIQSESDLLQLIIACIDYIFDEEKIYYAKDSTEQELTDFIETMQQSDIAKIQKFFETMPKLKHEITIKNPKTKKESKITLAGLNDFFA